MPGNFGRHVASEILTKAETFIANAKDAEVWGALSDPIKGRMTHADLAKGKKLHDAAKEAKAGSEGHAGDTAEPTHEADSAEVAAHAWLHNQLVHARGLLHETQDTASLAALDKALSKSKSRAAGAANVRAYVKLVETKDVVGTALSAAYASTKVRDAILKDGLHLADAVDAAIPGPNAAKGTKKGATAGKNTAIDKLARWLHRWSLVAQDVASPAGLTKLGLDGARHHPAHRSAHPAAAGTKVATPTS